MCAVCPWRCVLRCISFAALGYLAGAGNKRLGLAAGYAGSGVDDQSLQLHGWLRWAGGRHGRQSVFDALALLSGWVTYMESQPLCAAIALAALAFLRFNFPPARVFMGDAGSIPLGFLAAALGILGAQQNLAGVVSAAGVFAFHRRCQCDAGTTWLARRKNLAGSSLALLSARDITGRDPSPACVGGLRADVWWRCAGIPAAGVSAIYGLVARVVGGKLCAHFSDDRSALEPASQ